MCLGNPIVTISHGREAQVLNNSAIDRSSQLLFYSIGNVEHFNGCDDLSLFRELNSIFLAVVFQNYISDAAMMILIQGFEATKELRDRDCKGIHPIAEFPRKFTGITDLSLEYRGDNLLRPNIEAAKAS
jgi:hypothetical protein